MNTGDAVSLTLARNGRLLTLQADMQPAIPATFIIKPEEKLSGRQKKRLESWLGRDLVFK